MKRIGKWKHLNRQFCCEMTSAQGSLLISYDKRVSIPLLPIVCFFLALCFQVTRKQLLAYQVKATKKQELNSATRLHLPSSAVSLVG